MEQATAKVIQLQEASAYETYLSAREQERNIEQELAEAQQRVSEAETAYLPAPLIATIPSDLLQAQSEFQQKRKDAEQQLKLAISDRAQAQQLFEEARAILTNTTRIHQEAEQLVTGIERKMTYVFLEIESASLEAEQSRKNATHKLVALKEEAVRKERSLAEISLKVVALRREALQSITKEKINMLDASGLLGLRQALSPNPMEA